jgi:exopolysaccharide biosynthesis polyprenyl glycosylphosphotransferase
VNRKKEISKDLSLIFDGLLLGACLWFCYLLRASDLIKLDGLTEIPPFSHSYWMLAVIIPGAPLLLDLYGFYANPLTHRYEEAFLKMARAGFWIILIISMISIFWKMEIPSRSVLLLFIVAAPVALILRFWITKKYLIHRYSRGNSDDRSVIVGRATDISSFLKELTTADKMELQIARWFDLDQMDSCTIRKCIRLHAPDRVIFVSPDAPQNGDLPFDFESEGVEVWVQARNINNLVGVPTLQSAGPNRMLVFGTTPGNFWYAFLKRIMDILGALFGLLIFSPFFLLIALAIKFTSPGPVIFRQVRSGKRGRRFTIFKFRSMVANAPELHETLAHQNEMQGPTFKINRDPRVTWIGEIIRRTSLDELPQFLNVLRGEMSIVGPRPLPDYETEQIEKSTHRRRLSVKPGLTCLWQIRGRNSITSFEEWVQLDIEYIDNASLLLDFWIIIQTVPAVLLSKGAH